MSTTSTVPEVDNGPFGYTPTKYVCIIFITLFSISMLLHIGQAIKWRVWYMLPTMALGCFGELIGWCGRLWGSQKPLLMDPFLMQITSTIISPSFMSAANFTILGAIISRTGTQYSWLSPRWYLITFISLDLVSLVIQSIGGAKASQSDTQAGSAQGARIMLYGIVLQMIALTVYVILGTDFIVRYYRNKPARKGASTSDSSVEEIKAEARPLLDGRTRLMLLGLVMNSLFLFIRAIYRTIELNDGWNGPVITNQALFNWLDGTMIVLATFILNFFHPGFLLGPKRDTNSQIGMSRVSTA